jgi:hypothetical protein
MSTTKFHICHIVSGNEIGNETRILILSSQNRFISGTEDTNPDPFGTQTLCAGRIFTQLYIKYQIQPVHIIKVQLGFLI